MKIGIFGGSFNPVHAGHLKLAGHALSELNLDRVIFVPSFVTPLKDRAILASADDRFRKLQKTVSRYPRFEVSRCELDRKGTSYTVDTLRHFKKKHPKATLYFISGADTLKNVSRWKSLDKVLKLCRFVVATRPGYPLNVRAPFLAMPFDALDVSSTQIRQRRPVSRLKTK